MAEWRYCVVANWIDEYDGDIDEIQIGAVKSPHERLVYLSRQFWRDDKEVTVMKFDRFTRRPSLERASLSDIENIRCQIESRPGVVELMADDNEYRGMWWGHREKDYLDAKAYAYALRTLYSPCDDWLHVSEDSCTLSLYPYTGKAWDFGKQIIEAHDRYLYMNGYCWSSMIKHYLRSTHFSLQVNGIEMLPKEYVCLFCGQKSSGGAIQMLADTLRKAAPMLPSWVHETEFDEWDDWG